MLTCDLHCVHEHSCESEWHLLRKSFAIQCDLKAVAQIDVQHFAARVQHDVRRMPIAQAKNVADHRHHRKRSDVVRSTL